MKKIVIAAALLVISASAHAGTYTYEGVTLRVQDGCRSPSCLSVNAPGYGSYNVGHQLKVRKVHKDTSRIASVKKEDAAPAAAVETTPAKTPDPAPAATPSDAAPVK
jgi:hypothetical protein